MTTETAPVEPGDLVLVEYRAYLQAGQHRYELEVVAGVDQVGTVSSTTRRRASGVTTGPLVTMYTHRGHSVPDWRPYTTGATWLVPYRHFDVTAAWIACVARPDVRAWRPTSFTTLDDARAFLNAYGRPDPLV